MSRQRRTTAAFLSGLVGIIGIALAASMAGAPLAGAGPPDRLTNVNGAIWVANRGAHTIRGFDAATGDVVATVAMAANSQPGDLAYAKGKLYVAEEFGTPPAIAIVDAETGDVEAGSSWPGLAPPSRARQRRRQARRVRAVRNGQGRGRVTRTTDTLLGAWDTNPLTTNGRSHAGVFSKDGNTLYVASDARERGHRPRSAHGRRCPGG